MGGGDKKENVAEPPAPETELKSPKIDKQKQQQQQQQQQPAKDAKKPESNSFYSFLKR